MSGLEVAGVVLGAMPILIEGLKSYKNGYQSGKLFFRKPAMVNKLALALLLQRETLAQFITMILKQSGCIDTLEFDKNPDEYLRDSRTQDQVLEYLGSDNLFIVNETMKQSYDIVRRIARNIAGLVPTAEQMPTDDLRQIIAIDKDKDRSWRDFVSRVKVMFSASEISEAIREVDNTIASLSRLTNLIELNRRPVEQSSSRKAAKLAKAFRQVRRFAVDLHQAILQAWNSGCHNHHEAKLLLEDRIEAVANAPRVARSNAGSSAMGFRLIFAASSPQKGLSWHRATVKVSRELADEDPNPLDEPSVCRNARVTLILPENASAKPTVPLVDDICAVLASIKCDQKRLALILSKDQKMGTVASNEEPLTACDHAEKVTLKALFCDTASTSRRGSFPLKDRMMLALGLASNLLQLSQTPWLRTVWSKDEIFFLQRPSFLDQIYDYNRPYISISFSSSVADNPPKPQLDPKVAILELGILLLEIWHNETLESHFPEQQNLIQYHDRLNFATQWLDDPHNQPLPLYDKAVSRCIHRVIGGETRFPDWENTKFWDDVCQDVIGPLHEICKQWRSLPR